MLWAVKSPKSVAAAAAFEASPVHLYKLAPGNQRKVSNRPCVKSNDLLMSPSHQAAGRFLHESGAKPNRLRAYFLRYEVAISAISSGGLIISTWHEKGRQ